MGSSLSSQGGRLTRARNANVTRSPLDAMRKFRGSAGLAQARRGTPTPLKFLGTAGKNAARRAKGF